MRRALKWLVSWVTGPVSKIAKSYIESRENVEKAKLEASVKKEVLTKEVQEALLADAGKRDALVADILAADRTQSATRWVRPVAVGLSISFWTALVLSQARWLGYDASNQLLPVVWDMPPGQYGELLFYLPMGVIGTFVLARPLEKIWGKK